MGFQKTAETTLRCCRLCELWKKQLESLNVSNLIGAECGATKVISELTLIENATSDSPLNKLKPRRRRNGGSVVNR
jgi:hypothetical protein